MEGVNIVFADVLKRWSKEHSTVSRKPGSIAAFYQDIATEEENIATINIGDIKRKQANSQVTEAEITLKDGTMHHGNRIRIQEKFKDLQLKIIVEAHCGERGY